MPGKWKARLDASIALPLQMKLISRALKRTTRRNQLCTA